MNPMKSLSLIICLALMVGYLTPVQAVTVAEKETTNKQFQDWAYQCGGEGLKDEQCFIMQNIFIQESGMRLLRVVVGYLGPDDSLRLFLTTPLDIYLPAGTGFNIVRMGKGGEEYKIPIHVCKPGGCRAFIPLDKNLIWAMKMGSQVKVSFVDNNTRKQISVEVSLAGFTKGLEALGTKRLNAIPNISGTWAGVSDGGTKTSSTYIINQDGSNLHGRFIDVLSDGKHSSDAPFKGTVDNTGNVNMTINFGPKIKSFNKLKLSTNQNELVGEWTNTLGGSGSVQLVKE